jgi:hypothetical protein
MASLTPCTVRISRTIVSTPRLGFEREFTEQTTRNRLARILAEQLYNGPRNLDRKSGGDKVYRSHEKNVIPRSSEVP